MTSGNYEFPQSDFFKRLLAKEAAKGLAEGQAEGLARGQAEGRAEGQAKALLTVLEARGVHVRDEARVHILGCTEATQLEAWIRRAVAVDSVDQLFTTA